MDQTNSQDQPHEFPLRREHYMILEYANRFFDTVQTRCQLPPEASDFLMQCRIALCWPSFIRPDVTMGCMLTLQHRCAPGIDYGVRLEQEEIDLYSHGTLLDNVTGSSLRLHGLTLSPIPSVDISLRVDGLHEIYGDVEEWLGGVEALFAIAPATLLAIPGMSLSLHFYVHDNLDLCWVRYITVPLFPPPHSQ
jgi:hypothetical protein